MLLYLYRLKNCIYYTSLKKKKIPFPLSQKQLDRRYKSGYASRKKYLKYDLSKMMIYIFGKSGSLSPFKLFFPSFVCLSLLASGEALRVAIGFKAV